MNPKIRILLASYLFLFAGVSTSEDSDLKLAQQIMERFLTPKPISDKAICGLPFLGKIEKIERFISLKVIANEQNYRLVHVIVEVWQHRSPSPDDLEKKRRGWLITLYPPDVSEPSADANRILSIENENPSADEIARAKSWHRWPNPNAN